MKYLILVSFLFSASVCFSQPITQRSSDVITVMDGNLFAKNSFRPAVYNDTTAANLVTSLDSCGKMIFTYADNSYWLRACSPKRWVKILKTGDVSSSMWGSITGTLSNQTDLQNALDLKINNTNIGSGFRWLNVATQELRTVMSSNTILWDSTSTANTLTPKADTSILATQYDLTQIVTGGGLIWKQSATALTGDDTTKIWIKTPSTAAVYNVYTYVRGAWERFGWLDSVDNVFSTRRPRTILVCGQSNAAGVGPGGDTAYIKGMIAYSTGVTGGVSNEYQTLWVPARIGISPFYSTNNNIGFQVGKRMIKNGDADIVRIITTYEGGTSLASWIGSGGDLFLLDTLRSRLNRSGIDTIDIFLWHQGESGGITGFTLGGYVVDQRVLYDTLTSTLTTGFFRNYTKYIAGGLGNATDSNAVYNVGSPEGGQRTLNWDGNLNTAWVPSWGLTDIGDGIHFTGTSLDSLGYRYYTEAQRLPHSVYEEKADYNYDLTYDSQKAWAERLVPYNGGGSSIKYIDGISLAYNKGANPVLTVDGGSTSGAVRIGASTGYSDVVPKMLHVNGKALISDGVYNSIISGNWNITGDPQRNIIIGNYPSSFTGAAGGDDNVMIGHNAGYNGTRSLFNSTIIGSGAATNINPLGFGDNVVAIGKGSLASWACLNCAFVGNDAGASAQGNALTGLGTNAGALNSTGRVNSTAIGANAKYNEDSALVAGNALKRFIIGGTTSLPFLVGVPSNGDVFKWVAANSQFELGAIPSAITIYSGDGTLASDRTVSTGGFTTTWTGSNDNETSFSVVNTGTTNASAISGSVTGTTSIGVSGTSTQYIGVIGTSTSNNGVQGQSTSGTGVVGVSTSGAAFRGQINPTSTNAIENMATLLRTSSSGAGANGIGGAIQYELETATSGTSQIAGSLAFKFTDATNATRTSQFSITGVNNAVSSTIATFDGNGNATFGTTNSIVGTATNNDAVAGNLGEEINSTVSTYTNYTTTATYQNISSITLTPGDWDLSAFFTYSSNSATITAGANGIFVISTTTASAAGATEGKNIAYVPQAALLGTSLFSDAIAPYRVSISSNTTYYLNTQATFTLGNPQFVGTIRARRVR